jgi:hypothetical protein
MRWQEPNALQIRVALAEIEPAIWRRLIVPLSFHLGQLHALPRLECSRKLTDCLI